jgi:hypothetical protein
LIADNLEVDPHFYDEPVKVVVSPPIKPEVIQVVAGPVEYHHVRGGHGEWIDG